jgi:transcriptional regulator with XRE-family HTH domain
MADLQRPFKEEVRLFSVKYNMADAKLMLASLRKTLELSQAKMAARMGLSLRPYQELESGDRRVRSRHIRLAESVALDIAVEKQNIELAPDNVRKKVTLLALMLLQQNLEGRPLEIARNILGQDAK